MRLRIFEAFENYIQNCEHLIFFLKCFLHTGLKKNLSENSTRYIFNDFWRKQFKDFRLINNISVTLIFRTKMRCLNQCDKISHFLTIFKSLNFLHFSTGCWHICQVVLTPVAMSVVYLPSNALALPTMT